VVDARSKERRQGEVEQHEDRPDSTEEQEGVGSRRVATPPVGDINHWRFVSILNMV
jgi:hypothetical protein